MDVEAHVAHCRMANVIIPTTNAIHTVCAMCFPYIYLYMCVHMCTHPGRAAEPEDARPGRVSGMGEVGELGHDRGGGGGSRASREQVHQRQR